VNGRRDIDHAVLKSQRQQQKRRRGAECALDAFLL
jgi:hypothetical protein